MRHLATTVLVVAASTALALAGSLPAAAAPAPRVAAGPPVATILSGLTANKAVAISPLGHILVADQAADGTGQIVEFDPYDKTRKTTVLIDKLPTVPADIAMNRFNVLWILYGGSPPDDSSAAAVGAQLWAWSASGGLHEVADLGAYAAAHPDPNSTEDDRGGSNPYSVAPLNDGSALVADAEANAVRRVWLTGGISTVAHLLPQLVSTAAAGDPKLPAELPAQAVPTTVAQGPDGAWYVGELKGYPFAPGTSRIWRIKPGTRNASCGSAVPDPNCTLVAGDYTAIIDMTFGPDGALYVLELAKAGVGAVENADPHAPPPPGALLRTRPGGSRTELDAGGIILPGGVVVSQGSRVYVTDFQLVPDLGRLQRIG